MSGGMLVNGPFFFAEVRLHRGFRAASDRTAAKGIVKQRASATGRGSLRLLEMAV